MKDVSHERQNTVYFLIYFLLFSSSPFSPLFLSDFFWRFETEYTSQVSLKLTTYHRLPWNTPASWLVLPLRRFHKNENNSQVLSPWEDERFSGAEVRQESDKWVWHFLLRSQKSQQWILLGIYFKKPQMLGGGGTRLKIPALGRQSEFETSLGYKS